jgi:hypothetical protein
MQENKIPGLMLPMEGSMKVREVFKGMYVIEDDPYTNRYSFFESPRPQVPPSVADVETIATAPVEIGRASD